LRGTGLPLRVNLLAKCGEQDAAGHPADQFSCHIRPLRASRRVKGDRPQRPSGAVAAQDERHRLLRRCIEADLLRRACRDGIDRADDAIGSNVVDHMAATLDGMQLTVRELSF
jgi:hypothetical protein